MKRVIAILFVCSVAFSQVGTVSQSSGQGMWFGTTQRNPNISISAPGGKVTVTINTDTGEIKYGEGVTPSEAAQSFYKAVGALFRTKTCDAQAGAQPATSGKPATEKPVTVTDVCEKNCKVGEASR